MLRALAIFCLLTYPAAAQSNATGKSDSRKARLEFRSLAELRDYKLERGDDTRTAETLGYKTIGDGGAALYYFDASSSGEDDGGSVIAPRDGKGRWIAIFSESKINVKWFGAVGDGKSDDTLAIKQAARYVQKAIVNNPTGRERMSYRTLYFPGGSYKVTEAGVIVSSDFANRSQGLVVEGDGPGNTQIVFEPKSPGYLFDNQAYWNVQIRNMTFHSNSEGNRFWKSTSVQPKFAVQRMTFNQCEWSGKWDRGFFLTGNNNNSEWSFNDCGVTGYMGTFVEIPKEGGSDQFLGFWFNRMKFWPTATTGSNFIDFNFGGNVSINDCDFSGLQSGLLFALRGNNHARGVCRFSCTNSRFELKHENCKVLFSEWPNGTVTFKGNDFGSQAYRMVSANTTTFDLLFNGAVGGPHYIFQENTLVGKTAVRADNANRFRLKENVRFTNCYFPEVRFIEDSFTFEDPPGNTSGRIPVSIEDCIPGGTGTHSIAAWQANADYKSGDNVRSDNGKIYKCEVAGKSGVKDGPKGCGESIADNTAKWNFVGIDPGQMPSNFLLNWRQSKTAQPKRYIVSITSPNATLPNAAQGPQSIMLPPDAIIVKIWLYSPPNAVSENDSATFSVQTSEPTPHKLLDSSTPNYANGIDQTWEGNFSVGTDKSKRLIQLVPGSDVSKPNESSEAFCLIEYVG